jgi:hypothetical protein
MDGDVIAEPEKTYMCFTKYYIFRGTIQYHWDVIAEPEETYCVPKGQLCTKVKVNFLFFHLHFSFFFNPFLITKNSNIHGINNTGEGQS